MRSLFLVLASLWLFLQANATVLTVSNHVLTAGQYTTLAAAYAAANVGDTLYLHGSPTNYGSLTINKRITLIGAGYNDSSTFRLSTMVSAISIDSSTTLALPISGVTIIGMECASVQTVGGLNNVTISRCRTLYDILIKGNGWIVENSLTNAIYFMPGSVSSCILRNNMINFRIGAYSAAVTAPGLLIDHNIIYSASGIPISNISYAVVSNNIFFGVDPSTSTVANCSFNNNMAIGSTAFTFPSGSNISSGNVSTLFTTYQFLHTLTTATLSFVQIVSNNWHLRSTSLGHNNATDGTDMGIYGGSNPMSNMNGTPGIMPQMTLMTILNSSVPAGTPVNVRFKSRKVN